MLTHLLATILFIVTIWCALKIHETAKKVKDELERTNDTNSTNNTNRID